MREKEREIQGERERERERETGRGRQGERVCREADASSGDMPSLPEVARMAGRPRSTRKLKQWMEEQVDGGNCPGLVWEDRDQGMFRIPWKHAGKQDYRHDEDAAIFKAWAKFKGKYKEGDKADPATWKTRLRCALNKSCEFEEVPARSQLDISEPYKVYRIMEVCAEKREAAPLLSLDSVKVKRERRSTWGEADTYGETETPGEMAAKTGIKTEELDSGCDLGSGSEGSGQEEGSRGSPLLTWMAQPSPHDDANTDPLTDTLAPTPSPSETEPNALSVCIRYGGTLMRRAVTRHGCRICWCPGPYRGEVSGPGFGSQSLARLQFPPASRVGDPAQQSATAELLPFLERGVMLDSSGHGIFGQRLCQGRVYWRGPTHSGSRSPTHSPGGRHTLPGGCKLERERVEKLFDRQLFMQQLERYRRGEDGLPQHQVTLCFGEELNPGETADKKLITVEVHQVAVEKMVDAELELENSAFLLLEPLLPVLPEAGEVYPDPLVLSPLYSSA